jgi:hypothetical protein
MKLFVFPMDRYAGTGGAVLLEEAPASDRKMFLFIVVILIGGSLLQWSAIHFIDAYAFD